MNQIVRDLEAEDFICRAFKLLNGVVNPNTPVLDIRFVDSLDDLPLGYVALGDPSNMYILVGCKNIVQLIEDIGDRIGAYGFFIDFVVHELYHTTQNIDLPRYVSDVDYYDLIETDCEYHTTLFLTNYIEWILSHLDQDYTLEYKPREKYYTCKAEDQINQRDIMLNDPWIIKL